LYKFFEGFIYVDHFFVILLLFVYIFYVLFNKINSVWFKYLTYLHISGNIKKIKKNSNKSWLSKSSTIEYIDKVCYSNTI